MAWQLEWWCGIYMCNVSLFKIVFGFFVIKCICVWCAHESRSPQNLKGHGVRFSRARDSGNSKPQVDAGY